MGSSPNETGWLPTDDVDDDVDGNGERVTEDGRERNGPRIFPYPPVPFFPSASNQLAIIGLEIEGNSGTGDEERLLMTIERRGSYSGFESSFNICQLAPPSSRDRKMAEF